MVVRQGEGDRRQFQFAVRAPRPPRSRSRRGARQAGGVGSGAAVLGVVRQRRRLVGLHDRQCRWFRKHDVRRHRQRLDHFPARRRTGRPRDARLRRLLRRWGIPEARRAGAGMAREAVFGGGESDGRPDLAPLLPLRPRACRAVHRPAVHRRRRLVPRGGEDVCQHPGQPVRGVSGGADRGPGRRHELRAVVPCQGAPAGDHRQEPARPGIRLEPAWPRHRPSRRACRVTLEEGLPRRALLACRRDPNGDARGPPPGTGAVDLGEVGLRARPRRRAASAALHRRGGICVRRGLLPLEWRFRRPPASAHRRDLP